jgi:adenylate cyclase
VAADEIPAVLERELLGGERRYTRREVAERAGVPVDQARILWRALGFADVSDDNVAFTERDADALRAVNSLVRRGVIDTDTQLAMTRAMGQSLARLADWHVSAITDALSTGSTADPAVAAEAAHELVPVVENLIGYVWRRHLAATAGRALADDRDASGSMAVGFADLVGFTSLTRDVGDDGLAVVVDSFEALAGDVVAENAGRIVKTLGDEVMFTTDDPSAAAEIALALTERVEATADLPELRIGLACGPVLSRLGDVYGEPVNIASRLTSIARPGSVLVDREMAAVLGADERFRLRRVPPRPVRGYALLHASRLRRAGPAEAGDNAD